MKFMKQSCFISTINFSKDKQTLHYEIKNESIETGPGSIDSNIDEREKLKSNKKLIFSQPSTSMFINKETCSISTINFSQDKHKLRGKKAKQSPE